MSLPTSGDRSPQENRDRDVENLLGQFLVASFQANKLSELIRERFLGFPKKDIRLIIPGDPPLSVSVRIEPYVVQEQRDQEFQHKVKSGKKFVTVIALAESPPLEVSSPEEEEVGEGREGEENVAKIRSTVDEAFTGLFKWWKHYGRQTGGDYYLKLDEWKAKVSILDSQDAVNNTQEFIRSLDALEAKRKEHIIGSP